MQDAARFLKKLLQHAKMWGRPGMEKKQVCGIPEGGVEASIQGQILGLNMIPRAFA